MSSESHQVAPVPQDASPEDYQRQQQVAEAPGSDYSRIISVLNETKRAGGWQVPAHLEVSIALGEVRLDLRDAHLSAPVTTVSIHGLMGEARVIVPPQYRVDCTGVGVAGTYEVTEEPGLPSLPPGAPMIRFTGGVFLGEVTIIRTAAAVGEGSFKVDGMAGLKHRRRARRAAREGITER